MTTNLSPAAQAVVNAVDYYETNHWLTPREVAAARAILARWGNHQVSLTSSTQPLPEQEVSK
jgi:hypothetical protein